MNNLVAELEEAKSGILKAVAAISRDKFNTVPFKDSWTAGQVSDHLLQSLGVDVLYGTTETTDRAPDQNVAPLASAFLDFTIKMKSPDFILPGDGPHDQQAFLTDFDNTFNKLITAAKTLDLSQTCLDFKMPVMGALTRLEFLWFYVFHTKRHTNQLQNIAKALA
ncbi:DinB family protein [Mucilaginibacter antarcticus]|uniref:DinB family protein n=1 Tax=Mucilaginibacter antarcticus TaxID=1855725 RepID=A0ABW5XU14_9SPHI